MFKVLRNINAASFMDRKSVSSCYEANYFLTGKRTAAFCHFNKAIINSVNNNAVVGGGCLSRLINNISRRCLFGLLFLPISVVFILYTGHKAAYLNTAVANCGIKFINIGEMLPFRYFFDKLLVFVCAESYKISAKLTLNGGFTLFNIFLSSFFFKPRANFIPCLSRFNDREPISAGTLALLI